MITLYVSSPLLPVYNVVCNAVASVVYSEGRKVCKKYKVAPDPATLKHYKDGAFHKDYDRRHTVASMVNFMRDPAGDLPWDEDAAAEDVLHLSNAQVIPHVHAAQTLWR